MVKHTFIKSVVQNADIDNSSAVSSASKLECYTTYAMNRGSNGGTGGGCGQGCTQSSGASCGQSSQRSGK